MSKWGRFIVYPLLLITLFYGAGTKLALSADFTVSQPIDFILSGEDILYDDWGSQFIKLNETYLTNLKIFSQSYTNSLNNCTIKAWRDKEFNSYPSEYLIPTTIIVGNKEQGGIRYTSDKVIKGFLNMVNIQRIITKGKIVGMFIEQGKIFVVSENSKESIGQNTIFAYDIPILIQGIFQSPDYCIWQTIDPPSNIIDQDKYGVVYYGGLIENTHVGSVLFEADRIMKCLSNGYDNRTGEKITLAPWFKSEWDFIPLTELENNEEEWQRYWFTIDKNAVLVDPVSIIAKINGDILQVKTEKMFMINGHLESSRIIDENSPSQKWTNHFNEYLNQYQTYYPVLDQLEQLARWSALLIALQECGVVFDGVQLNQLNNPNTPKKTPVIKIVKETTIKEETEEHIITNTSQLILVGGVGFDFIETQNTNLLSFKNYWLQQYNLNNLAVERIF